MKHYLYILSFLVCSLHVRSQVYQPIAFPEKVDKKYIFSPLADEEKLRKKVAKKIPRKHVRTYTYGNAFYKANMFKSGNVYLSWPSVENYVNQILDSILPGTLKNKKIKAYIGRSSEINAFCLYDGTMIVNAGLIAEVKNEAALAAVMGHELAHYIKNHSLNSYIKSVKERNKKSDDEVDKNIQKGKYSQKNELEADETGYGILKDAGYDVTQAASIWELFIREKEYDKKRKGSDLVSADSVKLNTKKGNYTANTLEKLLSTHPDEKEREGKLKEFLKNTTLQKKIITKIDADHFKALQKQARLESIALLFNSHNYSECLERAFRFHLFEPFELTYMYYVAESIRRICLMDYTLRKKGFLTERQSNDIFQGNKGILHDLRYLVPNEEEYKKIAATELINKSSFAFETYRDAFYYFTQKLIKKDYAEAYLIAALFENNKEKRQTNINKYLNHPRALHKDYAKNYIDNTLLTSVNSNTGEIVMIPQVDFYSHFKYNKYGAFGETKYYYDKSEIVGSTMANNISNAFNNKLEQTKSISLPEASTQNFNTKEKYVDIITSSFLAQREENEGYTVSHYYKELEDEDYVGKLDIFRLNPEIWDFFKTNKINAISYAKYTRHYSRIDNIFKRPALYLGIPTLGFTWLFLPGKTAHYRKLTLYSYDSRAEVTLASSKLKWYKLNSKRALKMFKSLQKEKNKYIQETYSDNS